MNDDCNMDKIEKNAQREESYRVLCIYNLWRKGHISTFDFSPKELGNALEVATGAIIELEHTERELQSITDILNRKREIVVELAKQKDEQVAMTESTMEILNQARAEIERLRHICTDHGIDLNLEFCFDGNNQSPDNPQAVDNAGKSVTQQPNNEVKNGKSHRTAKSPTKTTRNARSRTDNHPVAD